MPPPPNLARLLSQEYIDPFHRRQRRNRRRVLILVAAALFGLALGAVAFGWWTGRLGQWGETGQGWWSSLRGTVSAPPTNAGEPANTAENTDDGVADASVAPSGGSGATPSTGSGAMPPPSWTSPASTRPPSAAAPAPGPSVPAPATPAAGTGSPPRPASAGTNPSAASRDAAGNLRQEIQATEALSRVDPAAARAKLARLLETAPADAAPELLYRLGLAANLENKTEDAEAYWLRATQEYPVSDAGRYAALALADRAYARYVVPGPQNLDQWETVWNLYSRALSTDDGKPFKGNPQIHAKIRARCEQMAQGLVFGPAKLTGQIVHVVSPNERLGDIARHYGVNYEMIAKINGIDPNKLRVGMKLKIIKGDVYIVVRKNGANRILGPTLTWYLDRRFVREYPACVGEGMKTPPGEYITGQKMVDPTWTKDGVNYPYGHPENILGTRWITLEGMGQEGLGIHGTTVPDTIPGYTSAGCVRLQNQDVEELYGFARRGDGIITKVTIVD